MKRYITGEGDFGFDLYPDEDGLEIPDELVARFSAWNYEGQAIVAELEKIFKPKET